MREDMSKVIVERPRHKAWGAPKGRVRDMDELPRFQGMNRFHAERGWTKMLNENLAPLRRYLFKQVGRPWTKIYAEISVHLRADNPVQQHVRDHLTDYVNLKPRREVTARNRWLRPGWPWREPLYVDARTGLLCRTDHLPEVRKLKRQEASRPKPQPDRIALSPRKELRRLDGLWYEVEMAPLPKPEYIVVEKGMHRKVGWGDKARYVLVDEWMRVLVTPPVYDVVTHQLVFAGPNMEPRDCRRREVSPQTHFAITKRALSRKELRVRGLENGWSSSV